MKILHKQTSFVGGEVSENLFGREDLKSHGASVSLARNVLLNPQGDLYRMPGTKFVGFTYGQDVVRLQSFIFSTKESFLLVFSPGRMQVYKDDVYLTTVTDSLLSNITAQNLKEFDYVQSLDVALLAHQDFQTLEISRINDTNWEVRKVPFKNIPTFPFNGANISTPNANLTPEDTIGEIDLTANSSIFSSGHVGQYININDGQVKIISYESGTKVRAEVLIELVKKDVATSGEWELETGYEAVMSDSRGWPRTVTFDAGRLKLGGLKTRPQTWLESRVGEYYDFDEGRGEVADGYMDTIGDDDVNIIDYLVSETQLLMFTNSGEYFSTIQSDGKASHAKNTGKNGTAKIRPVKLDDAIYFVEQNGKAVRELIYSDSDQRYTSDSATLLSNHIVDNAVSMAARRATKTNPSHYLIVVNGDGSLAVLNTLRKQNLRAWTSGDTEGQFEEVCVVGTDVYFIVKRSINGVDVRCIEKWDEAGLLHCALRQEVETATDSFSGFDYLEGQMVHVQGDGYEHQTQVVTGGQIFTDYPVTKVEVGLAFYVDLRTLPVSLYNYPQIDSAKNKRLSHVSARLLNTRQLVVESGKKRIRHDFLRFGENVLAAPPTLFTGWKNVRLRGVAKELSVRITQDEPVEFHVLSLEIGVSV